MFTSRSMNLKSLLIIWYLKNQCASGSKLRLTISHHSRLRQKYSSSSSTRHHSLIIFSFSNWFNNSTNFSIYTIFDKIKAMIVQNQTAKTTIKIIATNQYKTWISSAFLVLACAFATSSCFSAVNLAQWFCNLLIVINAFIYLYVGRPFFLKSVIKLSILSFVISTQIQLCVTHAILKRSILFFSFNFICGFDYIYKSHDKSSFHNVNLSVPYRWQTQFLKILVTLSFV